MSTTCVSCGEPLAPAAQFCALCGAPRAESRSGAEPYVTQGAVPPVSAHAQTTTMPAAPPITGSSWAAGSATAAPSRAPGQQLRERLLSSLDPATVLVFTAAALAFGLSTFVYAYADAGDGNGPQVTLALLLVITIVAGALGTFAAWHRLHNRLHDTLHEERTAARMVFGVGVFATVLALLQFFAALGR